MMFIYFVYFIFLLSEPYCLFQNFFLLFFYGKKDEIIFFYKNRKNLNKLFNMSNQNSNKFFHLLLNNEILKSYLVEGLNVSICREVDFFEIVQIEFL